MGKKSHVQEPRDNIVIGDIAKVPPSGRADWLVKEMRASIYTVASPLNAWDILHVAHTAAESNHHRIRPKESSNNFTTNRRSGVGGGI